MLEDYKPQRTMRTTELTNEQWQRLKLLLPPPHKVSCGGSERSWTAASFPPKRVCEVSKTKSGQGTKLMRFAGGNDLPTGFCLPSANRLEVKLVVPTLETV